MSFRSLPRDEMCQKAPSNSSLSGLDMPPRIPRCQENTQKLHRIDRGCFHSEEVLGSFDTACRVATRSTRSRGLTLLLTLPPAAEPTNDRVSHAARVRPFGVTR